MAKGKTNQPLCVWVDGSFIEHPGIKALAAQGHNVVLITPMPTPDLILHPAAHLWNDYMWDYLPAAIVAARKRKRETK